MIKSKLIPLFYFITCVILGLLLSNFLLLLMLYIKKGNLMEVLSDSSSLLESLSSHELLMTQMSSQIFSLIIPAWIYSRVNTEHSNHLNTQSFNLEIFSVSMILFFASLPFVALSAYFNQHIPLAEWMTASESQMSLMVEKMLSFYSVSDLIIAIIVIAVVPAIAEEWVFRGILQKHLIEWTKNKWLGLLIASLVFSAIHLQFQGFLPRFILGLVLGFVYLKTGNLWYSILLHFFNNGAQVVGVYFYREEVLKQVKNDVDRPEFITLIISSVVLLFSLYYIHQKTKHLQNDYT